MPLQVCILGIDGSGKSTVTAALPAVLAAELGIRAGSAGEQFLMIDPEEDHLAPRFHPDGFPLLGRLSRRLKRLAKRVVDRRRLYPVVKVLQMVCQDHLACRLAEQYLAAAMVSDGNALLSATGRAANYLRPASLADREASRGPSPEDLCAVFRYFLEGKRIPETSQARLPDLRKAHGLCRVLQFLGVRGVWLPDLVIFLDLSPRLALERIARRGGRTDQHENEEDLAQAREMYLRTLDAFARYRDPQAVMRLNVDALSPGEILNAIVDALRPRLLPENRTAAVPAGPLGGAQAELAGRSFWRRVFTYRYLVRYLAFGFFRGAWREPLFVFSRLGRLFLRQGYSAEVMRVIYDQDEKRPGATDRVFLGYPLHRAVYDRLHLLTRVIEPEIEARLERGDDVAVYTAPSGFAYDLFRPLEALAARHPDLSQRVRITAADLDPRGVLERELPLRAEKSGIRLEFLRGDLTSDDLRARAAASAPFDLALFVGLSSWLPKPRIVDHLRWVREHLRPGGLLVTDAFTPDAYSLSGRYIGYRAHYFSPQVYAALLDSCGFDGLSARPQSGRDGINHVMVFSPRPDKAREKDSSDSPPETEGTDGH